jgi:hypothetical protein
MQEQLLEVLFSILQIIVRGVLQYLLELIKEVMILGGKLFQIVIILEEKLVQKLLLLLLKELQ